MNWRNFRLTQLFHRLLGRWLRKKGKINPETQARELVLFASGRGYKLMHDPEFRRLMQLDSVDQFEDGRIFNELAAAMLTLLFVYLREQIPNVLGDKRLFWRSVQDKIIPVYIAWLSELGIQKDLVDTWEKLLEKRFREYDDYRREALGFLSQHPLEVGAPAQQVAYLPIMTISAYVMTYLRRGKHYDVDKQIQLLLQKHLMRLHNDLVTEIGW